MAEYLKKFFNFGANDKYTEVHLNKNEEKYYFNKQLNQWVFGDNIKNGNQVKNTNEKNPPNKKQILQSNKKIDIKSNIPRLRYKNYLPPEFIINNDNNNLERKILEYEKEINNMKLNHKKDIEEYQFKINELTTLINFNESSYNETINILKDKISDFIDKNLILKQNLDNVIEEKKLKINEIESYKKIINQYQELISNNINQNNKIEDNLNINDNESKRKINILIDDSAKFILNSQIERLKSENLLLSSDLNKLKIEFKNNNELIKDLNEQILSLNKEIHKKNYIISTYEKKNNLTNNSIELSSPSLENSNLSTQNNTKSFYKQLNKLTAENHFLRNHREKLKTKIYSLQNELNSINNYEEEISKLKDELYISQHQIIDLSNEIHSIYKFIQKQIDNFSKYKIHNFNYEVLNRDNLFKYLKDVFNKTISYKYINDFNENKKKLLEEEIKHLKMENEIIYDQLNDYENDTKFNTETLIEYEKNINKLQNNLKDINNKFNNCNIEKDNLKKKVDELQLEINNLLYDNQSLNIFNQKLLNQYNEYQHLTFYQNEIDYSNRIQIQILPIKKNNFFKSIINPFLK
jgi:chromosome segregation ATPase